MKKWNKITDEIAYNVQKLLASKNKTQIAKTLGIGYGSVVKASRMDLTSYIASRKDDFHTTKTAGEKAWETRKANLAKVSVETVTKKVIAPVVKDNKKSVEAKKNNTFTINYEGVNFHISEARISDVYFGKNEVRVVSK